MRMWSLEKLWFILCTALSCVMGAAGLIHVAGYEGQEVNISCSYGKGYETYEKYLCKNGCGWDDVLITTTQTKKNKYSIHDDRKKCVVTMTISGLSHSDAGQYWCGVTITGTDIYTEVKLEVRKDTCCDQTIKVQSYEESSVSFSCPYDPEPQNSLKYVCRGNQPSTCLQQAVITSDNQQNGKFKITDDMGSRKFTVTIAKLTRKDSGFYLCGVQQKGLDAFSAVQLDVKEWCCVSSNTLSSTVGQSVTMQCPFPPQHEANRKFLCKGDHRNNCTDMVTPQSRFTLQDDASLSFFKVTITELQASDAGTYWCGSDSQWSAANYTKIQLSVVFQQQTGTVISTITEEQTAGSGAKNSTHITDENVKGPAHSGFVVYTLPPLLLILLIGLVIVYKYKCHKVRGAAVSMNANKISTADPQEAVSEADMYANQDFIVYSKKGTSTQQSSYDHYDNAGEEQQDSVYQNCSTTEEIYCNEAAIIKAKR